MIFGYIRVSSDKQTTENQRFEINEFCKKHGFAVEKWFDEVISGTKKAEERKLGRLLEHLNKGDILICSEISRLGRNLLMVMSVLNICVEKGVQVWTIRDNFRLSNDVSSKVLAFAFGLAAEIERSLISHRTRESLARLKSEGVHVGRPAGSKSRRSKLSGKAKQIQKWLDDNVSKTKIAEKLNVHPSTLRKFLSK